VRRQPNRCEENAAGRPLRARGRCPPWWSVDSLALVLKCSLARVRVVGGRGKLFHVPPGRWLPRRRCSSANKLGVRVCSVFRVLKNCSDFCRTGVVVSPGLAKPSLIRGVREYAEHLERETNPDKRRAVEIALREFGKLSDREIARMCGVSQPFVGALRPRLITVISAEKRRGADGRECRVGVRTAPPAPKPEPLPELPAAPDSVELASWSPPVWRSLH
jgi:hypothetical protein